MVHGGACITRLADSTTVLVDGAIPDERIVVELHHRTRKTWFGNVAEVIVASAHRTTPPCPYVPECGGCNLQHVVYPHQLELKRAIVLDALRRARVGTEGVPLDVHGMEDPWRYRWRGEFHVIPGAHGQADATLGFNRARSWTPVAVERCLIHHSTINACLPALRDAVRAGAREGLDTIHLTVGEGGRELLVRGRPAERLDPAALDAASLGLGGGLRLAGHSTALSWRQNTFRIVPEAFMQVNWSHMEVLYHCILDGLDVLTGLRVVDAYAGIGVLGIMLSRSAREVVCIEESRASATLGVRNAELNGVADRVRYVAEPVETSLPGIAQSGPIDALVLDPPRSGCDHRVTAWLALAGPGRIVYASCDPATLARDLQVLTASGPYRIERIDIVDMFPQTHHVETVVSLSRSPLAMNVADLEEPLSGRLALAAEAADHDVAERDPGHDQERVVTALRDW